MYGLPWHASQSDSVAEVLIQPLAPWLKVEFVPWDGISPPPLPPSDQPVCFFELAPPCQDPEWRERSLVWIPMWDHSAMRHPDPNWWAALPRPWRVVAFSEAVAHLARYAPGRSLLSIQFHRDPATVVPADWNGPRVMYYWNRLGLVGPDFLKRICRALRIERLLFRPILDPNIPLERHYLLPHQLGGTTVEEVPFHKSKVAYLAQVIAANFLLAPRPFEGIGMVMVDALARGCAVLAADAPSASEYIRSGYNGVLMKRTNRRQADRLSDAATWWGGGNGFLLSNDQDWEALARIDWAVLGMHACQEANSGAQAWQEKLPDLASFLLKDTMTATAPTTVASLASFEVTSPPLVSICLPHLNSMPFTQARLDSIRAQTWPHWECIVVDSSSTDGSQDLLREAAFQDSRIQIYDVPRQGIYPAFNDAIQRASGEFIYIATADNTLYARGLERMVQGLVRHPDCGACHTPLIFIDERGECIVGDYKRYPHNRFFGLWMDRPHIRRHPHDAVLFSVIPNVYISVTQMLYRRDAVACTGPFPTEFGSFGDFAWHMRLAASTDILHLPEAVGTWRRHQRQASQAGDPVGLNQFLFAMVRWNAEHLLATNPDLKRPFVYAELGFGYRLRDFQSVVMAAPPYRKRALAILRALIKDPGVLRYLHHGRWSHDLAFNYNQVAVARTVMTRYGVVHLLQGVEY